MQIGDTVLYGTTGVCRVSGETERSIGGETKKYFVLEPLSDGKCTVFVPKDNEALLSKARKVLSKEEILEIIDSLPQKEEIWVEDAIARRELFSEILKSGNRARQMLLIRSLYNKQQQKITEKKRLHITDERMLDELVRLLHDEFSAVLGIEEDEVAAFIASRLEKN